MNIYVSNLAPSVQDEELGQLFATFGTVSSNKVIFDKISKQSRGFGFVEMDNEEAAQQSIAELNGTMNNGQILKVVEARPKEDRTNRNNNW